MEIKDSKEFLLKCGRNVFPCTHIMNFYTALNLCRTPF